MAASTVFTGKAELGQGFKTAFQQIAAEELDVPFASLKVVTADTQTHRERGLHVRQQFCQRTAAPRSRTRRRRCANCWSLKPPARLDLPVENFRTENGAVIAADGRRLTYGELVRGRHAACAGAAEVETEGPGDIQG